MHTKHGSSTAKKIVNSPTTYLVQYHAAGEIGRERQKVFTPVCTSPTTAPTPIKIASTKPPTASTGARDLFVNSKKLSVTRLFSGSMAAPNIAKRNEATRTNNPTKPISRPAFHNSAVQTE